MAALDSFLGPFFIARNSAHGKMLRIGLREEFIDSQLTFQASSIVIY
jgi:hypothetical protein